MNRVCEVYVQVGSREIRSTLEGLPPNPAGGGAPCPE